MPTPRLGPGEIVPALLGKHCRLGSKGPLNARGNRYLCTRFFALNKVLPREVRTFGVQARRNRCLEPKLQSKKPGPCGTGRIADMPIGLLLNFCIAERALP